MSLEQIVTNIFSICNHMKPWPLDIKPNHDSTSVHLSPKSLNLGRPHVVVRKFGLEVSESKAFGVLSLAELPRDVDEPGSVGGCQKQELAKLWKHDKLE